MILIYKYKTLMEFNINWSKEDNDKLREMIKNKFTVEQIRDHFGNDKLFYHPDKKYYHSGKSGVLPNFKNVKKFDNYITGWTKSYIFEDRFDYIFKFQTNSGNRYVVDFIYLKDSIGIYKDKDIYNVSFTLEENRNIEDYKDYEKQSYLNEQHEIIKRIIFIFKFFHKKYNNCNVYLLGETENLKKINWYRNLIKDTFPNVKETKDVSSFTNGLPAYYFEVL
jgi:hypothetical protein